MSAPHGGLLGAVEAVDQLVDVLHQRRFGVGDRLRFDVAFPGEHGDKGEQHGVGRADDGEDRGSGVAVVLPHAHRDEAAGGKLDRDRGENRQAGHQQPGRPDRQACDLLGTHQHRHRFNVAFDRKRCDEANLQTPGLGIGVTPAKFNSAAKQDSEEHQG